MERKIKITMSVNGKPDSCRTVTIKDRTTWEGMGRRNPATVSFRPKKGKGSYNRQTFKKEAYNE